MTSIKKTTTENIENELQKKTSPDEENKTNKGPVILWSAVMLVVCVCLLIIRHY